MRQLRFNPKAINALPPVEICPSCGQKFTPSDFNPECPLCRKTEQIILEVMFDEKPRNPSYKQSSIKDY